MLIHSSLVGLTSILFAHNQKFIES